MRYVVTLLSSAAVLVASAAALNWTIDPAEIFRKTLFGSRYAQALLDSKYGLVTPDSLDEREFKVSLAKHAPRYDCVVIGSSHIMQVGNLRKHRSFPRCKSILNLGVSGAGIEDHIALSWTALSAGKPRTLILSVDPWTFAFGKDERWKVRYAEQYSIARMTFDGKGSTEEESSSRWSNLVNAQYTKRSLAYLLRGAATPSIDAAESTDEDVGGKFAITLPDGSHVYSAEYISSAKIAKVPVGGATYKTDGTINDPRAIDLYRQLIAWADARGVHTVLLMTPYHQNVWELDASPNVKAMMQTEAVVREIGKDLKVPVVGSFRPEILGCSPDEFYDFMHPMATCLAKFTARAED